MALALELDCNSPARIGRPAGRVGSCNAAAGRCVKVDYWERPTAADGCAASPCAITGAAGKRVHMRGKIGQGAPYRSVMNGALNVVPFFAGRHGHPIVAVRELNDMWSRAALRL
jgi:hypothetical protein